MRCPDCNKFVSLEFQDPELESGPDIDESGGVTAVVRIVRACADCGTELKEATLGLEADHRDECKDHVNAEGEDKHDLLIEEDGVDQVEEGGGRYAKSYFGAEVQYRITCKCSKEKKDDDAEPFEIEGSMSDKVAASHMDEMV